MTGEMFKAYTEQFLAPTLSEATSCSWTTSVSIKSMESKKPLRLAVQFPFYLQHTVRLKSNRALVSGRPWSVIVSWLQSMVGFPGAKLTAHRACTGTGRFIAPALDEPMHAVVSAVISRRQFLEQPLGRTALPLRQL